MLNQTKTTVELMGADQADRAWTLAAKILDRSDVLAGDYQTLRTFRGARLDITDDKEVAKLLADVSDIHDKAKLGTPTKELAKSLRDLMGMIGGPRKPSAKLDKAVGKFDA